MFVQLFPKDLTQQEVLHTLREHLTRNIVRMGSRWFTQIRGIPQVRIRSIMKSGSGLKLKGNVNPS